MIDEAELLRGSLSGETTLFWTLDQALQRHLVPQHDRRRVPHFYLLYCGLSERLVYLKPKTKEEINISVVPKIQAKDNFVYELLIIMIFFFYLRICLKILKNFFSLFFGSFPFLYIVLTKSVCFPIGFPTIVLPLTHNVCWDCAFVSAHVLVIPWTGKRDIVKRVFWDLQQPWNFNLIIFPHFHFLWQYKLLLCYVK